MNPTYQQMMIQQLMGQDYAAQGTTAQNAGTPYGQSFVTGGQMQMPSSGMLGTSAPTNQTMQQSYASYPGMG